MFTLSKSIALIASSAAMILTSTASAQSDFTARFDYAANAPISQTYARFEKTAEAACTVDRVKAGGVAMKKKVEARCVDQLMTEAVAQTQIPALIAYHDERTGRVPTLPQYAQAE